jgi:hypothetical protein
MRDNLTVAAAHFDLKIVGRTVFGWRLRSISAQANGSRGTCPLRMVSQERQWAPGQACSPTDALRSSLLLSDTWWSDRTNSDQQQITQRIHAHFGDAVDADVDRWETVHGDLHWSNLVHPRCGLLDWQLWGRGPVGTDAATLYCYSLSVPATARKVYAIFADALNSHVWPGGPTVCHRAASSHRRW